MPSPSRCPARAARIAARGRLQQAGKVGQGGDGGEPRVGPLPVPRHLDRPHPDGFRPRAEVGLVVDHDRLGGRYAQCAEGTQVDLGVGLGDPDLAGQDQFVRERYEAQRGQSLPRLAAAIAHQRDLDAASPQPAKERDGVRIGAERPRRQLPVQAEQAGDQVRFRIGPAGPQDPGDPPGQRQRSAVEVPRGFTLMTPPLLGVNARRRGEPVGMGLEIVGEEGFVDIDKAPPRPRHRPGPRPAGSRSRERSSLKSSPVKPLADSHASRPPYRTSSCSRNAFIVSGRGTCAWTGVSLVSPA